MAEVTDPAIATAAAQRLPPIGFWSYSRQDDELSDGKLSKLRRLLVAEIQQQYGRDPVQLFQDRTTIPHGAEWEQEIRGSIDEANFFIPIVTPNFIQSEWCAAELLMFLEREQALAERYEGLPRRSRIFPINFIDIGGVDPHDPRVLAALEQRQAFDFTGLRYRNLQDDGVQHALGEFATSIRRALQIKVRPARPGGTVPTAEPAVAAAAAAPTAPPREAQPEPAVAAPLAAMAAPPHAASGAPRQVPGRNTWIGLAALGAAVTAGAVYLVAQGDDPSDSGFEVASETSQSNQIEVASASHPPAAAAGGQFDRLKQQLNERSAAPNADVPAAAPPADMPAVAPPTEAPARTARVADSDDRDEVDSRAAEQAGYRSSITRVLAADAVAGSNPVQVFRHVSRIDLDGTPTEFRRAYRAHVEAWRDRAAVERMPLGPERQARLARVDGRVRTTYNNVVAIARRYGVAPR